MERYKRKYLKESYNEFKLRDSIHSFGIIDYILDRSSNGLFILTFKLEDKNKVVQFSNKFDFDYNINKSNITVITND